MPTVLDPAAVRAVEDVFIAGIQALGIDNGAAKGDIKLTSGGPMVGEIAARLSGGYMSGWTFPLSSGIEVTEAAMNVAVGMQPGDLSPRVHRVSAERALISIPGTVAAVAGEENARRTAGIAEVFLRTGPNQEVVFPANNVEKCGNVISAAEDREGAIAAAREGVHALFLRLQPLMDQTTAFLFREKGLDAFTLSDADILRAIAAMPPFRGDPRILRKGSPICVEAPAGFEREPAWDWHELRLAAAVDTAVKNTSASIVRNPPAAGFTLSGLFWRAMLRGSVQGGAYLIDSVRLAAERGNVQEFLAGL
jgi:hypothetical protein